MMRTTLAMTLGLGLGLTLSGCGPTAEPPAAGNGASAPAIESKPEVPKDGGAMGGPPPGAASKGGGGNATGPSPEALKGMMSDSYRAAADKAIAKDKTEYAADKAKEEAEGTGGVPKKPAEADKPKDDAPKAAAIDLSADEIAEIKTLPDAADRDAALAQKICPVNEDENGKPGHLGAMGAPIKVEVKGKTIFVCCKSCVDDVKKDPEKYLSKIGK